MRWLYRMGGSILFVVLVGMSLAGEEQTRVLGYFLWLGFPFVWLVLGNSVRCPRCGKHILDNGRGYVAPWIPVPTECVGCGRGSKSDWWPFQWLLKPEHNSDDQRP